MYECVLLVSSTRGTFIITPAFIYGQELYSIAKKGDIQLMRMLKSPTSALFISLQQCSNAFLVIEIKWLDFLEQNFELADKR